MRVAYFTPLTPQHCGISDHSEELLPYLAKHAEIDVVVSGTYRPSNPSITSRFRIVTAADYLNEPGAWDAALYQLGNNLGLHEYMVPCLRAAPGIVVLQDYCLQYLVLGLTLRKGELGTLDDALRPVYGDRSRKLARRLLLGLEDPSSLTFAHPFLDASRGVVAHSRYVEDLVRQQLPSKSVRYVPMGVSVPPSPMSRRELRQRYDFEEDEFIVASVSTRAPKKRLDVVLEALARTRERVPKIRLLVVGGGSPGVRIHRLIRELGLSNLVEQTGWVEAERYLDLIRLSDVAVDLREMTAAETANSALRSLAAGTPVVVSARGTFLELPDDCCPKIAPDDEQAHRLGDLLVELAGDPRRRDLMASAALAYSRKDLSLSQQASELMEFVDDVVRSTSGTGPVRLLEPYRHRLRFLLAPVYSASRLGFLLRSYGVADSLRRLRGILASRLTPERREVL